MRWYLNLSTGRKLALAFSLELGVLAAVIGGGLAGIASLRTSLNQLYEDDFKQVEILEQIRAHTNLNRALVLEILLTADPVHQRDLKLEIEGRKEEIQGKLGLLRKLAQADLQTSAELDRLSGLLAEFWAARASVVEMSLSGRAEEARQLSLNEQGDRFGEIHDTAKALAVAKSDAARGRVEESGKVVKWTAAAFSAAAAAALAISLILAGALNRVIARPLNQISIAATAIAAGDLTQAPLDSSRTDEVGALSQAFDAMARSLRDINGRLKDTVGALASSAGEIATSSAQVAAGATETASAVSETTSTVGEVRQASSLAAQKAKQVSASAQHAAQIALEGREAVEAAAGAMERIQIQMGAVASSVMRLSEQGQAIGEIIATVGDLAEQSNLLAVNAAIEAARAGEHGAGFGVVAQEVRNLAEQSKQATGEVRAILGGIQKATGSAVMATEQGSKAAESSLELVAGAQDAIRKLADTISESAQSAAQIAASCQQQFAGMDQIASAMENVNQATVQNLAGTRQTEEAARNLHDLGQQLKGITNQFNV